MSTGKYLTFALDKEEYGVPVLRVREIIKIMDITNVPQLPRYVKGVINLRGKVIPIVDIRLKFGLPDKEYSDRTCIVVVGVAVRNGMVMMGVVVDSVSDVLSISVDELGREDSVEPRQDAWLGRRYRPRGLRSLQVRAKHYHLERVSKQRPFAFDRRRYAKNICSGLREERDRPARRQTGAGDCAPSEAITARRVCVVFGVSELSRARPLRRRARRRA